VACAKDASDAEQENTGAELSRQFEAINVAIAALRGVTDAER